MIHSWSHIKMKRTNERVMEKKYRSFFKKWHLILSVSTNGRKKNNQNKICVCIALFLLLFLLFLFLMVSISINKQIWMNVECDEYNINTQNDDELSRMNICLSLYTRESLEKCVAILFHSSYASRLFYCLLASDF